MRNTLRFKQDKDRVLCIWNGRKVFEVAFGEALEIAAAWKRLNRSWDGIERDGRWVLGAHEGRLACKYEGRLAFIVSLGEASRRSVAALREVAKKAEHWKTLNVSREREALYRDNELLVGAGLRKLNLGMPAMEFKQIGGLTVGGGPVVHVPGLIDHGNGGKGNGGG